MDRGFLKEWQLAPSVYWEQIFSFPVGALDSQTRLTHPLWWFKQCTVGQELLLGNISSLKLRGEGQGIEQPYDVFGPTQSLEGVAGAGTLVNYMAIGRSLLSNMRQQQSPGDKGGRIISHSIDSLCTATVQLLNPIAAI